jgi:hypothetical protein
LTVELLGGGGSVLPLEPEELLELLLLEAVRDELLELLLLEAARDELLELLLLEAARYELLDDSDTHLHMSSPLGPKITPSFGTPGGQSQLHSQVEGFCFSPIAAHG